MSDRWTRRIVIGLLLVIVGVPLIFQRAQGEGGDDGSSSATGPENRLVLISPHNETIRYEIGRGFNAYRKSQGKSTVAFDWRSSGGTSDLRKQVLAELEGAAREGREEQGLGYDVFFGGGDVELNRLASGITIDRGGKKVKISALVPVKFPEGMLKEIYPEPTIAGEALYHKDMLWFGVVLSSFGIVYNRDLLTARSLPEPTNWTDLTDGRYFNELALADPAHSGSVAAAYHAPLRRLGWTDGWALLRRVMANGRYITASGSKPSVDVSAGEATAGMTIDLFGRFQAGAVGGNRLGYVEPVGMTTTNSDPIGILRGAPHREIANEFVLWLLSKPAQRLWQRRIGTEEGPLKFELRRMPIRRDLYDENEMANWTDKVNPFRDAKPFPAGSPIYFAAVGPLSHAIAIDVHDDLRAAWLAISNEKNSSTKSAMLALFDAMPEDLTMKWPDEELAKGWHEILESKDHPRRAEVVKIINGFMDGLNKSYNGFKGDALLPARLRWTMFFRENYRKIQAMSTGD